MKCEQCPMLMSTRRIHSRAKQDCKSMFCSLKTFYSFYQFKSLPFFSDLCAPGTYARKRDVEKKKLKPIHNINPISLSPFCNSCEIDYYQPEYGQIQCIKCPNEYTTTSYRSKSKEECIPNLIKLCQNKESNICHNGTCVLEDEDTYYSCECKEDYIGSHCEIRFNFCLSNPCLNKGKCILNFDTDKFPYTCECPEGFVIY